MTRFEGLFETVVRHQALAAENYDRIRTIALHVRDRFCAYLDASGGECVRLAPPFGPFELRAYDEEAFSLPPTGFRPICAVAFGLAIRVTQADNWVRLSMSCAKEGEAFRVEIADGKSHVFSLPLSEEANNEFFDMLYSHLIGGFAEQIRQYEVGDYGGHEIGFEMNYPPQPAPKQG